jgi:cohesin loading factor subunit SCC2
MSDTIIIQAVYIAIGPFFVVDGGGDGGDGAGGAGGKGKKDNIVLRTLGKSAMRGLRLDALSLIRSVSWQFSVYYWLTGFVCQIFANHEDQRSWIIEEILTSLIKLSDTKQKAGQFRYVLYISPS